MEDKKIIKLLEEILKESKERNKYNDPLIKAVGRMSARMEDLHRLAKEVIGTFNIFNKKEVLK